MSDVDIIEETQMEEEAQPRRSASPRPAPVSVPVDPLGIVQQFKTAAERSFQMYQDLESQRQAMAREEASVDALLRRQGELKARLRDASAEASGDQERVASAQQALLAAQGQYARSALQVDVLDTQLRVVDAEVAASEQRVAERRQVLHSMCAQGQG